jgi:hypothetical protein
MRSEKIVRMTDDSTIYKDSYSVVSEAGNMNPELTPIVIATGNLKKGRALHEKRSATQRNSIEFKSTEGDDGIILLPTTQAMETQSLKRARRSFILEQ